MPSPPPSPPKPNPPTLSTSSVTLSETSTAVHSDAPASPLMANLNRLSQATSRPNLPPPEGIAVRAARRVSTGLGLPGFQDKASEELDDLIRRRMVSRRPSASVDTNAILYPTLENHPAPNAFPLLVLNLAAATLVPANVSNDELLEILLRRLEPWVGEEGEGGYCLIVLAAEEGPQGNASKGKGKARALPGVAWWLWHWRRIPRKFRKNLKRLYIVHPSTLTRTVLPLILPLVSPKSYAKVHTVPSLVALTHFNVPLRGMDLPLSTLAEEARILAENPEAARRSSITNAIGRRPSATVPQPPPPAPEDGALAAAAAGWGGTFSALTSIVGTATSWLHPAIAESLSDKPSPKYWAREIEVIVSENNGHVPRVIQVIGTNILKWCTGTEGIFRRSTSSNLVRTLQDLMDLPLHLQPRLDWAAIAQSDPLLPPIMLKKILASLSPPVFSQALYPLIRTTRTLDDISSKLIPALSPARAQLLDVILHIAHHCLAFEGTTRMGSVQLALMLAPSLISGHDPREDVQLLMEPGLVLPAALGGPVKSESSDEGSDSSSLDPPPAPEKPQTLVGVLEIWIKHIPELHGRSSPCDCGLVPSTTSVSQAVPAHGQQHALLNAQGAGAVVPPVETGHDASP